MRGNNFKEKKVVPLIFTQFWIHESAWLVDPTRRLLNINIRYVPKLVIYKLVQIKVKLWYLYCFSIEVYNIIPLTLVSPLLLFPDLN